MATLARLFDFTPSTPILSGDVDAEFNQIVNLLNSTSTNKNAIVRYSNAGEAPLLLDQLSSGPIQIWRAAGIEVTRMKVSGQIVGYPRCIHSNPGTAGNIGAGLDNLHSFVLPAASLATNGDYLHVRYAGAFATNNNDKRIQISLGGVVVDNTGLFDQDSGNWSYDIYYIRESATTIKFSVIYTWGLMASDGASAFAGNGRVAAGNGTLTVSSLDSNAQTLLVAAEGTSNSDITQNLSVIELTQTA